MVYCINPKCIERNNPDDAENCLCCGTPLLINRQYRCINHECKQRPNFYDVDRCQFCGMLLRSNRALRLIRPLRPLERHHKTEIFEIVDEKGIEFQGEWVSEPGTHKVMKVVELEFDGKFEMLEREAYALTRLGPGLRATCTV